MPADPPLLDHGVNLLGYLPFSEPEPPSQPVPESPAPPERVIVKPEANSRLEALLCQYSQRKAEYEDRKQAFDELKSAITAELESAFPDESRPSKAYELQESMMWPRLSFTYSEGSYFLPSDEIKAQMPAVYDHYKKRKKGFWSLREGQQGKPKGKRG